MQEGTATQTQTEEPGIELAALSSARHSIPVEPSAASDTSVPDENFQPRLLHSDSYDVENAEICTAVIRNIPRKPLSDKIHLKVRDIKSNKIARRTFKAMLVFGIITLLYQFTSLGPQFQGAFAAASSLKVQIKGETDARQSNALEFLSICADRKVRISQRL
jgi:hypothetical protein